MTTSQREASGAHAAAISYETLTVWCCDEMQTATISGSSSKEPAARKPKSFFRRPSKKAGSAVSQTDTSSSSTSSTLDDISTCHSETAMVRRLSQPQYQYDRQRLPPRIPPQQQQIGRSLRHQFAEVAPPTVKASDISVRSERSFGPIDLDTLCDEDDFLPPGYSEDEPVGALQKLFAVVNQDLMPKRSDAVSVRSAERSLGPIDVDTLCDDDDLDRSLATGPVDVDSIFSGDALALCLNANGPFPNGNKSPSLNLPAGSTTLPVVNISASFDPAVKAVVRQGSDDLLDDFLKQIEDGRILFAAEARLAQQQQQQQQRIANSCPVDVDDFIPEESYWYHDHEVILDEDEIWRGLVGYQEGFEPETINDVSLMTWNEEDDEDGDDFKSAKVLNVAGQHRGNTTAAMANSTSAASRQQRQLPHQRFPRIPRPLSRSAAKV